MQSQAKAALRYQAISNTDPALHTTGLKHTQTRTVDRHRQRNLIETNEIYVPHNVVPFCKAEHDVLRKALFHLIDHIFDNVFTRLSEGCKKDVITELWKLVPYEVLLNLDSAIKNRWTKLGITEAYCVADQTSNEFCIFALSKLLNFTEEPIITDVAINFIGQHYPDAVYISKANSTFIQPRSTENSKPHTKLLLKEGYECDFTTIDSNEPKHPTSLNKTKRFIIFFMAGIAITSIICYIASFLYFSKTNEQTNEILRLILSPDGSTQVPTDITTVSRASPLTAKPAIATRYYVNVGSYESYRNALFKLMHDREITLEVSFENDDGWPVDFPFGDTHMITELKIFCGASIYKVFNFLRYMQNAQNITIYNIESSACNLVSQGNSIHQEKTVLSNTSLLKLENLGDCPEFLKSLSEMFVFSYLNTFHVFNATLEKHGVEQIKKLISNSRYYLKSIEFSRCVLNAPLFENNIGTYKNVEFLHVDFLCNDVIGQINKHISNVFPNLRTFISSYGFVNWNTLLNFSGCLSLQYIKVGLRISQDSNSLSLIPFLQAFQKLKFLHLSLNFVGRNRALGCKVVGLEEVEASLNNFTYRSNCLVEPDIR